MVLLSPEFVNDRSSVCVRFGFPSPNLISFQHHLVGPDARLNGVSEVSGPVHVGRNNVDQRICDLCFRGTGALPFLAPLVLVMGSDMDARVATKRLAEGGRVVRKT